ncbi:hypothetical protein ACIOMM_31380 [Streptomyces sp. NPDC087908]|uniref:hypothetical protein n=1 Tax=unclassified Streptomyces TaxID=2593676 RepID=UPI0011CDA88E|nr:hypothetical protein [Streptomyces sp. adm13(2018)]TXS19330.1 hypothetical protein EAO70_11070 [Streptomyces sp. adm13(2018)]
MRNDIETREIADAELDAVSGGLGISGGLAGAVVGDVSTVLGTVTSLQTVQGVQALPGVVTGLAGVNVGVAGL